MKIFAAIKQVPDTETKINLRPDASGVDLAGVKWVMNPYDEFAVEEAIKLRDAGQCTQVVAITVGPKSRTQECLRTALAMGADEAIAIDAPEGIDISLTAKALAAAIKAEGEFRMILTGKLAIDDNAASVPQMLAEHLGLPHATVISKLTVDAQSVTAERDTEGGRKEILQISGPLVLAANKGLNVPRYASLPGIMKAKKKTIKDVSLSSLGLNADDFSLRFVQFALPREKAPVKMISGDPAQAVHELVRLLREESKVV